MFSDKIKKKASDLIQLDATFGINNQSIYTLEELSELSKEILKDQRGKGNKEHIKEEIADVLCTILTYAIDKDINVDELEDIIDQKLDRAINRALNKEF